MRIYGICLTLMTWSSLAMADAGSWKTSFLGMLVGDSPAKVETQSVTLPERKPKEKSSKKTEIKYSKISDSKVLPPHLDKAVHDREPKKQSKVKMSYTFEAHLALYPQAEKNYQSGTSNAVEKVDIEEHCYWLPVPAGVSRAEFEDHEENRVCEKNLAFTVRGYTDQGEINSQIANVDFDAEARALYLYQILDTENEEDLGGQDSIVANFSKTIRLKSRGEKIDVFLVSGRLSHPVHIFVGKY